MGLRGRIVSPAIGRGVIIALGGLYVTLAGALALIQITPGASLQNAPIDYFLVGGAGLVLMYGGYQVPQTEIRSEFYSSIALWCLSGFGVMFGILSLYHLQPTTGISSPEQAIPILTSLSSVAGFGAGIYDAKAKTRAREVELRNEELQQTQERLERNVEQLQTSNERLEQFAYAASHDLQEPLRMVSSYLTLIERREDELSEEGQEFLEFAVDGADRMRSMIEILLEYSRIETRGNPFEAVELDAVLDDVVDDLQVEIENSGATISADSLPRIEGDEVQLRQVFQNLLTNAIEYRGDKPPHVQISAERNGTEWLVSVRDEGIGIDSASQKRIFDVFYRVHNQTDHAGSGIGLALCERIIEHHGGEIWVESEPKKGSTFSFTLPRDGRQDE